MVIRRIIRSILKKFFKSDKKYYPFSRTIMYQEIESFIRENGLHGKVLEIGGFKNKRKSYILGYNSYIAINLTGSVDSIMDAHSVGFKDNVFDLVIIDQVLEHVRYPIKVLEEAYRVLRTNGFVITGVPMLVPIHAEPEDYWRFTRSGLNLLLTDSGFVNVSTGSWGHKLAVKEYLEYSFRGVNSKKEFAKIIEMPNEPMFPIHSWGFGQKL